MSSPNITPRFPFEAQIAKLPPEVQDVHRTSWNAITDLQTAIPLLKAQIDAKTTTSATGATTTNTVSGGTVTTNNVFFGGTVNDQTGETVYRTQQADNGALVILNDASPVDLQLNTGVTLPFWIFLVNQGVSLVTATPTSGLINYAGNPGSASLPIPAGYYAICALDGRGNFWAATIPQPSAGVSSTIVTAALTALGTQGSLTFTDGVLTSFVAAT